MVFIIVNIKFRIQIPNRAPISKQWSMQEMLPPKRNADLKRDAFDEEKGQLEKQLKKEIENWKSENCVLV